MVAGQVGENTAGKGDTLDAALHARVGTHFHEGILAPGLHHLVQQAVESQMVGRGLFGRLLDGVDDVLDSGQQARFVAHEPRHLIEQRGSRGLAVSSGDAHQSQRLGGVVKPLVGEMCQRNDTVLDLNVCNRLAQRLRQFLTHDGTGTRSSHIGDETVRINGDTLDGDKHDTVTCLPRVVDEVSDLDVGLPNHLERLDRHEQL